MVEQAEQAPSREALADELRLDIDLPGALRWLERRLGPVTAALIALKGLYPERFVDTPPTLSAFRVVLGVDQVLMALRELGADLLHHLPAPLGFVPCYRRRQAPRPRRQHPTGADPPEARR